MRTRRGLDRLITFADAVVAIALTLLVLPLTEIAADVDDGQDVGDVLVDHSDQVGAFVLSFAVIWILWTAHHRTMEYFDAYDGVVSRLTLLWLFTIVVLPFVTELLSGGTYGRGAAPLYDGVLFVSALALFGISWWGHRHPELLHPGSDEVRAWLTRPASPVTALILLVALVLAVLVPAVGTWPLLALLLQGPIEHVWLRLRRRR